MDASQTRTGFSRGLPTLLVSIALSIATSLPAQASEPGTERQTSFSDRNYVPGRHINTISPVTIKERNNAPAKARRIEEETEKVIWTDARGTETEYRMYYAHDGTLLDFASVCSNYRTGSIDYRNCRKAARQWFGSKCNGGSAAGKMYCHARNAFRP
ncbi:hypothetical protein DHB74_09300 [Pseudomonas sp. G11-1]|uniref:Uncharacterized protein n=1 Tax=Halopseudomonas bauzanensis TaxID=653930 RepID=A0A4U0YRG7_9GAMM|nr:hypothetical protein [Halopseudomonas bauzanensis]EZQ18898.1 hypothetical protein CF98_17115 [Halopseudomonas bauzanensis]MCO5786543.1 hypothetical protein [Pseudomonas sp. G11-1]MCO5789769.1 hypothetical protein [Pseudomonas sp. G11-2]TKA92311.1 hypothetical protein FA869_07925 [Halopseudomonas bauzanensis]